VNAADRIESPGMNAHTGAALDFDAVFEAYWPRIHQFLIHFTGDPQEAQDLALETFIRLHDRPALLNGRHNVPGWLYRVAANLGYNALRAEKRRREYEAKAGSIQGGDDPAETAEVRQERLQVRRILSEIRPRSARLLLLRHAGLSYREVAEALGVAPGSVGTLLGRAEKEFEKRYRRKYGKP